MARGGGGGAWKVAYADFVTAMMALFMVMWISAQDEEILIATSQYFQSPFNSPMDASSGVMSDGGGQGDSSASEVAPSSVADMAMLNRLAQDFYKNLDIDDQEDRPPVEISMTNDGLRVHIYDRNDRPVFDGNTARFTEWGDFVMQNLAWLIDRSDFRIRIDGHTAAEREMLTEDYSKWELSSDRANASRRALNYYAVPCERFDQVSGYADKMPLPGVAASDNENERIEISLVLLSPLQPAIR